MTFMMTNLWNTTPREMSMTVLLQGTRNKMKTTIGCCHHLSPSPGLPHRFTRQSEQSGQIHHGRCIPLPVLFPNVVHPEAWTETEAWTPETEAWTPGIEAWTLEIEVSTEI
jgi:hypothetical protein